MTIAYDTTKRTVSGGHQTQGTKTRYHQIVEWPFPIGKLKY